MMFADMLEHNNAAMKQQFRTLCLWQEQMKSVHEEHKQKFEATRELVTKLRWEKQELMDKSRKLENALHKGTPSVSAHNSHDKSNSASQVLFLIFENFTSLTLSKISI